MVVISLSSKKTQKDKTQGHTRYKKQEFVLQNQHFTFCGLILKN